MEQENSIIRIDRIEADPQCDRYWVYYTEWYPVVPGGKTLLKGEDKVATIDAIDLLMDQQSPLHRAMDKVFQSVKHDVPARKRAEAEAAAAAAKAKKEEELRLLKAVLDDLPL